MTSTLDPRSRLVDAAPAAALDRAAGVELLGEVHGSGYKDGAALVRRADGQMVQIGPLMYALLASVDGQRSNTELAAALSDELGRDCDEAHVAALAEKLAAQGLLAGTESNAPPRRNPLLALRWKVLVTNERVTRLLTAPFTPLYRPFLVWPVVACFGVVLWFVLVHKGLASATSDAFRSPGLLLLVFALTVLSAGFHELGHAAACRYGGATPGGIGAGIYMVWPAFYTDVTDAYRLPRRDRLRVDLGGLYFNAIVSVATLGVWLAWRRDALLLLIALQLLLMVKNLSPVIRSDGYHVLADATGVPDLYAHIGPTLRRLLPWRRPEPSALTGRARLVVTLWVLAVVPVLLSLLAGAVVLLPRLLATAWDSGRHIAAGIPHESALHVLASLVQLLALFLPVLGSALVTQKLTRMLVGKAGAWSAGRPVRRAALVAVTTLALAGAAWAWWPSGQYRPVQPSERGTVATFGSLVSNPGPVVRPAPRPSPVPVAPGTHLVVSMIPRGGPTPAHPAFFVLPGKGGDPPVVLVTDGTAATSGTATTPAPTGTTATPPASTTAAPQPSSPTPAPVAATAFPFKLPSPPGPGDTQALATGRTDGGVVYDIAYALLTVSDGAQVTNRNSAYALASCNACTTVAVSFQVVLIVGRSNVIVPVDVAEALNVRCPACVTTAIADQIVVTLKSQPSQELVGKIEAALQQLNAVPQLGSNGTPAVVAAQVAAVQTQIDDELQASGQLANPPTTTARTTTAGTTTGTTPATTTTTTTTSSTTTATTTTTTSSTSTAPTATTTTAPTTAAQTAATPTTTTGSTTAPATTAATTTASTMTTTSGG